jgi:hypothetical protein
LLFAVRSEAISIGLAPSPVAATVGGVFSLDLVVAGLVGGEASALGSWDLDVGFDSSLMSFDSVTFGTLLGGPADSLQDALPNGAGSWNVAEISLLSPGELEALQPDSFVLATLGFSALAEGTSSVVLSGGVAGNGAGRPLELQLGAARVEIAGGAVVPEPGAALLFACGALLVARARRRAHS